MDSVNEFLNFEEEDTIDGEIVEDKPSMNGVCFKCFNTNFVLREQDGLVGVVYTATSSDSAGRPVKKLQVCGHGLKINY